MVRVITALNHFELLAAIDMIREYLAYHADAYLKDTLEQVARTYRYMLHYLVEGQEDPCRNQLYSDLREDLYGIVRAIEYQDSIKDSPELYYSTARLVRHKKLSISQLISEYDNINDILLLNASNEDKDNILKERDRILSDIFDTIWTLPPGESKKLGRLSNIAKERSDDFMLLSAIIGALTMGALKIYDRQKLITLIDIDEIADQRTGARTLTGILLILYRHANRLKDDYTLRLRFETWTDNLMNYRRLRELLMVFIRTVGSLQLTQTIEKDIMPDLMKASPEIMKKFSEKQGELNIIDAEENPEWEDIISKSGIKDKINRLERLQRDGADLMLMGLGRLKQMPFFNKMLNWFIPFTIEHSEIYSKINQNEREIVESLNNLNMFCDSDKYTFALMINQIPDMQRRQMIEGINAQMEQNKEEYMEYILKSSTPDFDHEALSYVRSLYRFYNFFRAKNEFQSPFGFPFNFSTVPFLNTLLREREIMEMVAEFYFSNKHYKEALYLFLIIAEDANEASLYEKIGYCYLQEENPQTALSYFEKAELLSDGSKWLCRNIARAAERVGDYDKAARYYNILLNDDADNIGLLKNYSGCLVNIGKYGEALKFLYKIDYINPDDRDTKTLIIKCLMRLGRFMQAHEIIESVHALSMLRGEGVSAEILLLSGNSMLATGHIKEAIGRFRQAMSAPDSSVKTIAELRKRLEEDWSTYPSDTFDRTTIPLITDAVTIE